MVYETEKNGFALAATFGDWFEVSRQVLSQSKNKIFNGTVCPNIFPVTRSGCIHLNTVK